jgi:hypothetical protein
MRAFGITSIALICQKLPCDFITVNLSTYSLCIMQAISSGGQIQGGGPGGPGPTIYSGQFVLEIYSKTGGGAFFKENSAGPPF